MFGKNTIMKAEHDKDGSKLSVVEIFHTIQGEGPLAGEPAIFIRLAGCNLACHFCDTDFESNTVSMSKESILHIIGALAEAYPLTKYVVMTGGEPMRQNIVPLINLLVEFGLRVQIETAGTLWLPELEPLVFVPTVGGLPLVTIVCSPKTGKVNASLEKHINAWKYIIIADELGFDGLPNRAAAVGKTQLRVARPCDGSADIYVQPCDEHDEEKNRANIKAVGEVAQQFGYRVSLQMHKYLELP